MGDSTDSWRPLTPIRRQGYRTVNRFKGGKKSVRRIHRLVLAAFVGPCPPAMVACHRDRDRSNNDLSNLRWDTQQANADDTLRHGMRPLGSRCRSPKLTEIEVVEFLRQRAGDEPMAALGVRFGVSTVIVEAIARRMPWRHLLAANDPRIFETASFKVASRRPGEPPC